MDNMKEVPITGVCQNYKNIFFNELTKEVISREELISRAEKEGFSLSVFRYKAFNKMIAFIIYLMFPFLLFPSFILFIFGFIKFFQKYVYLKKKTMVTNYVPDRRFKTGRRPEGYYNKNIVIKIPCNSSERKTLIKAGILYIFLSIIPLIIWRLIIMYTTN